MSETQRVDRIEIEKLIPHAGAMCLLDEVIQWDDKNISCISRTHLDINNPLREVDYLPIYALIEYGAQAMAIHGGLLAKKSNKKINEGYLAALRNVKIIENIFQMSDEVWERRIERPYGKSAASWIDLDSLIAIKARIDVPKHQEDARILREVKALREADEERPR